MSSFDRDDTKKKIIAVIAKELKSNADSITETTSFKDVGADSLDLFEIILRLEEKFGVEISDNDAEKIKTVKAAIDYVHGRRTK